MKNIKGFLIVCLLCLTLLPIGAFAAAAEPLFEAAVSLREGDAPTQFRVTQSAEPAADWPDEAALAMEVTPPDAASYTLLFPCMEGVEYDIAAQYLYFEDMNGDGILDVGALYAQGASNISYTYYLFDPADGQLHYASQLGILSNAYYDPDKQVILAQENDGVMLQYYSLFGFADGTPVALGTAEMEVLEAGKSFSIHTLVQAADGAVLLDETVPFDGANADTWNAQYEALLQILTGISPVDAAGTPAV